MENGRYRDGHKPSERRQAGASGEEIACAYIEGCGWRILERNACFKGGEIDIVALNDRDLVFVEVRSRRTQSGATPLESITWRKQRFLVRAAQKWIHAHPWFRNYRCRFDVIAIDLSRSVMSEHQRAAFEVPNDRNSY